MKQIEVAKRYIGDKEKAGNVFDESTPLGKALKAAGHNNGEAWCSYFQEAVFCEAFPDKNAELRKLFSASTIQTYKNFVAEKYDVHDYPLVGDLVIWQRYKEGVKQWQGHAGLVINVHSDGSFSTIEGNTNSAGSREGDSVQYKIRRLTRMKTGLNVLGFITIK
jgi:hypothetical protein